MNSVFSKIKWLYSKFKFSIPFIIVLIIISSISSIMSVGQALITKNLIDNASLSNSAEIIKWLIILGTILFLQILFKCIQTILDTYSSTKIKNTIQHRLYTHIIDSQWINLSKYHSVDLLTRCSNDANTITTTLTSTIPQIISLTVMFISSFYALINISKSMAIISLIIFPILIFFAKYYGKKQKKFYILLQKIQSKYNSFLQESFSNFLIIKSFCLKETKIKDLESLQNDALNTSLKKSYISCIANSFLAFSSFIGYFLVFAWGAFNLSSGTIMFGSLTAMIQLFNNIQSPIYGLSASLPQLISTLGAIDRLTEIENIPIESSNTLIEDIDLTKFNSISFNNVSFSYSSKAPVLKNISFSLNKGETIGLIGPSGGGKTTIIRLLLSLIYPNDGSITLNDTVLTHEHRNLFSYVPQGNTLFSGSIADNLKFGNPNASEEDIFKALKMSSAYDFVMDLDENINTIIGERGIGISEGQAQRLAIARAFLREKPILILDEATSSLDPTTELSILDEVKNLKHKPLCIIITHRPNALSICNKIFKLENNEIKEVNNEII